MWGSWHLRRRRVRLCGCSGGAEDAVGEPGHGGEHAEIAESAHEAADFLVLGENAPLGEENGPVALIRADKRQDGSACVGHVGADVGEIFEEPEAAKSEAGGFALEEKIGGAEQGNEQFGEGSAKDVDGVTKPTEEEMSAFVDDQIDVIEDEKTGAAGESVEKEKGVETEPSNSGEAGDRLPWAELFLEESHLDKRSKGNSARKAFVSERFDDGYLSGTRLGETRENKPSNVLVAELRRSMVRPTIGQQSIAYLSMAARAS